jgi:hypothetical protein
VWEKRSRDGVGKEEGGGRAVRRARLREGVVGGGWEGGVEWALGFGEERGCIYTRACWARPFVSSYWASSLTSVILVNRA